MPKTMNRLSVRPVVNVEISINRCQAVSSFQESRAERTFIKAGSRPAMPVMSPIQKWQTADANDDGESTFISTNTAVAKLAITSTPKAVTDSNQATSATFSKPCPVWEKPWRATATAVYPPAMITSATSDGINPPGNPATTPSEMNPTTNSAGA